MYLMVEQVEFSATILGESEFLASEPVWEVSLEIVVPGVKTDIFSEV